MVTIQQYLPQRPRSGIIGHRGLSAIAPENTYVSIQSAIDNGLDWVEIDVRITSDNKLVCIHDARLERTTDSIGWVQGFPASYLSQIDNGRWWGEEFRSQTIPIIHELVNYFANTEIQFNLEIKPPNPPSQLKMNDTLNAMLNIINNWPSKLPTPVVSCFHWPILESLRSLPHVPLGFLTEKCSHNLIQEIASLPNTALHCAYASIDDSLIYSSKEHNVPLLAYTVNDVEDAKGLLDKGVFGIFSDHPLNIKLEEKARIAS